MEHLIKKVNEGSISTQELTYLFKAFRGKEVSPEMEEIFSEYWERSSFHNDEQDSEKGWNAILTQIDPTANPMTAADVQPRRTRIKVLNLLKYAAFFVLAFGMSWFIQEKFINTPEMTGQYTKIEVANGSKSKIELPDGTRVSLNSGSFIRYPNNFGGNTREVYFEGEAYFDVKKNKNKPFIVNTGDIEIKVLGTQFNVSAYPDEENIETTLVKGEVEVFYKNRGSVAKKHVLLKPNQKLIFQRAIPVAEKKQDQPTGSINTLSPQKPVAVEFIPNTDLLTSWKDNKLEFSNVRFEDLIVRLERWYNVSIVILSPEIKNARLSGEFEKETIEQALKALNLAVPFRFEMNKNVITIYPTNA
jgi:ferric-dicitrate binding protein FerR (iron transport regulator)